MSSILALLLIFSPYSNELTKIYLMMSNYHESTKIVRPTAILFWALVFLPSFRTTLFRSIFCCYCKNTQTAVKVLQVFVFFCIWSRSRQRVSSLRQRRLPLRHILDRLFRPSSLHRLQQQLPHRHPYRPTTLLRITSSLSQNTFPRFTPISRSQRKSTEPPWSHSIQ